MNLKIIYPAAYLKTGLFERIVIRANLQALSLFHVSNVDFVQVVALEE